LRPGAATDDGYGEYSEYGYGEFGATTYVEYDTLGTGSGSHEWPAAAQSVRSDPDVQVLVYI
jgi:hypothetical protein